MISFIYFDVGGVVIDDFSGNDKWDQLKQELGVTARSEAAFESLWDEYAPRLNIDLDAETLLETLKKELGLRLPPGYTLLDGFVKRFDANPLIWPILKKLHQRTKMGLITNMYPGMLAAVERRGILPAIEWQVVLDSSVERLQKPDPKLFELAEKRAGATGQQILFIDNSPAYIEAARTFGWQAYRYDSVSHKQACYDLERFFRGALV